MKASLRSVRIAPKKANLIAKMVRGLSVNDALQSLERTNKKAARLLQDLIESAVANAEHNENQKKDDLVIKTLIVNKAQAYHRGYPIARGRWRAFRKFLSHIEVTLGVADEVIAKEVKEVKKEMETSASVPAVAKDMAGKKATADKKETKPKKAPKGTSQEKANTVKKTSTKPKGVSTEKPPKSS